MARSIDDRLTALRALDTSSPKARDVLRDALASTTGIVVAAAARRVADDAIETLVPELVEAFERLCTQGLKRDPGCRGRVAVARALHALDRWEERVFVAGLRVVQLEGYDQEDTAGELRGICGLAHAHFVRTDALDVLADLLVDPQRVARVAAAQALADTGRREAGALLRFKLHIRDSEPEVLAACIESLLRIAREDALDFIVSLLEDHDDRAEAAALGLGGARIARAREPLVAWLMGAAPEQRRRVGYLALALLRDDAANAYLLDIVRSGARADAIAAATALATFKTDASLAEQIAGAARSHKDATVRRDIAAMLG